MVVAEEDVFHAELKILFKLIGQWSDTAGVIKIIWFEAGEDDFVFMAVPNERAKDGMGFAELFEEVEGDGDIFGRAEHWVAKGDRKSGVEGKRVELGGRRIITKKKE